MPRGSVCVKSVPRTVRARRLTCKVQLTLFTLSSVQFKYGLECTSYRILGCVFYKRVATALINLNFQFSSKYV